MQQQPMTTRANDDIKAKEQQNLYRRPLSLKANLNVEQILNAR